MDHDNVFVITGDSGMGTTHGTLGAMIVRDLINSKPNEWTELYDPSRKPLKSLPTFVAENVDVAVQYTDWATPGEVGTVEDIVPGEGAVVRRGMNKYAVYRDEAGVLHERTAVCPHLGCIVRWNSTEKTWDCPCHGSRYDSEGRVLNGPTKTGLAESAGVDSRFAQVRRHTP